MNAEHTTAARARFTLHPGRWYAAEFIGDEFSADRDFRSHSPIRVDSLVPRRTGRHRFKLSFYHANYPEGVQNKVYSLQTLERGEQYILARSISYEPARLLMIYEISWPWLRSHFNTQQPSDSEDIALWLSRKAS